MYDEVAINSLSATFDTSEVLNLEDGKVIIAGPVYGDVDRNETVQAFDASQVLRHLVGEFTLGYVNSANADVTMDDAISALDASLILQYVVHSIPSLPVDTTVQAEGSLAVPTALATDTRRIEIPVMIQGGSDVYAFDGEMTFDSQAMDFIELIPAPSVDGFTIQARAEAGVLRFAAAGTMSDGQEGELFHAVFDLKPEVQPGTESTIELNRMRLNENIELIDIGSTLITASLSVDEATALPESYEIRSLYPNPFNPSLSITVALPEAGQLRLTVFNMLGQQVGELVNDRVQAGYRSFTFDGSGLSSGVYFVQASVQGKMNQIRKVVLMK